MQRFTSIGLIAKRGDPGVAAPLGVIRGHLAGQGAQVLLDPTAAELLGVAQGDDMDAIGRTCEVAVVVGGDGTLLGAARALARYDVPLVGVNLGRLGFLVDVSAGDDFAELDAVLGGAHQSEQRFLIAAEVLRDDRPVFAECALNDVVLRIREQVRLIEFETYVDGRFVSLQRADGMIAATPTGSTAYALSGGGPVLEATLDALLLLPICSHTFSSRPIVISADSTIELRLRQDNREAAQLVFDGQINFALRNGDVVRVRRSEWTITLLHPESYDFYSLLRQKLRWS